MNFDEKINILWVDDEIELLKPHIIFLEKRGYKIVTANNGLAGLDLIKKQHFDLILCDIKMPKKDGIEVLDFIRNHTPATPVVMISGHGNLETAVQAMRMGAFDYISKPPDLNHLLSTVKVP